MIFYSRYAVLHYFITTIVEVKICQPKRRHALFVNHLRPHNFLISSIQKSNNIENDVRLKRVNDADILFTDQLLCRLIDLDYVYTSQERCVRLKPSNN